jgi:diguanylate cyclase (GGDEF)-like protein
MSKPTQLRHPALRSERNLAMLFALLAALVVVLLTANWFLVLEPTLCADANSHARVLAQAEANAIEQHLDNDQLDLLRTDLEDILSGLLLLKDEVTDKPLVRGITLRMDYDQFAGPPGRLDLARGTSQCSECFVSEIPLYHPHNRQLVGVATFYISPEGLDTLVANFRGKLLWGAGAMLCVIGLAWAGAGLLLRRLRESEANLRGVFEAAPFPMVLRMQGDTQLCQANQAAKDLLALKETGNGHYSSAAWNTLQTTGLPTNSAERRETLIVTADGAERWALVSAIGLDIAAGPCQLVSLVDVSDLKTIQQELLEASLTDSLTGLHNRRHLFVKLAEEIERAGRFDYRFSIILFDLDRFKIVNDTFGHRMGDTVLARVAATMRRSVRDVDIVGRYGGEEFLIILPYTGTAEAVAIAERVSTGVKAMSWSESALRVTVSGGVCEYAGTSINELVDTADHRLYLAKRTGRDRVVW